MKKLLLAAALATTTFSTSASALDGSALLRYCNGPDFQFCSGYLLGIASMTVDVCYPSANINTQQMRAIVVRYLTARPEHWHREAHELVLEVLRATWPCQK